MVAKDTELFGLVEEIIMLRDSCGNFAMGKYLTVNLFVIIAIIRLV